MLLLTDRIAPDSLERALNGFWFGWKDEIVLRDLSDAGPLPAATHSTVTVVAELGCLDFARLRDRLRDLLKERLPTMSLFLIVLVNDERSLVEPKHLKTPDSGHWCVFAFSPFLREVGTLRSRHQLADDDYWADIAALVICLGTGETAFHPGRCYCLRFGGLGVPTGQLFDRTVRENRAKVIVGDQPDAPERLPMSRLAEYRDEFYARVDKQVRYVLPPAVAPDLEATARREVERAVRPLFGDAYVRDQLSPYREASRKAYLEHVLAAVRTLQAAQQGFSRLAAEVARWQDSPPLPGHGVLLDAWPKTLRQLADADAEFSSVHRRGVLAVAVAGIAGLAAAGVGIWFQKWALTGLGAVVAGVGYLFGWVLPMRRFRRQCTGLWHDAQSLLTGTLGKLRDSVKAWLVLVLSDIGTSWALRAKELIERLGVLNAPDHTLPKGNLWQFTLPPTPDLDWPLMEALGLGWDAEVFLSRCRQAVAEKLSRADRVGFTVESTETHLIDVCNRLTEERLPLVFSADWRVTGGRCVGFVSRALCGAVKFHEPQADRVQKELRFEYGSFAARVEEVELPSA